MNHEDLEITLDKELEEMILLEAVESKVDDELNINTSLNEEDDKKELSKKKKRKKFTNKKLKGALKIRTVLILLLTLIVNTYAWFIYISTASTQLNIHVKSWKFEFSSTENTDDVVIFSDDLYPGMKDLKREITAINKGETDASLSYTITSVKIFGKDLLEGKEAIDADGFKDLLKRENYPFDIQIRMISNGEEYNPNTPMTKGDEVNIEFSLSWEYERKDADGNTTEENDKIDTEIGNQAYDYYNYKQVNGVNVELTEEEKEERKNAIEIGVHIEAVQTQEKNETSEETGI